MNGCASQNTAHHDGTTGWRLPNVAELGAIQPIYDNLVSQPSSVAGTVNMKTALHWSSTKFDNVGKSMMWLFNNSSARIGTESGYINTFARCVKTF
jgi:hypothetical protein